MIEIEEAGWDSPETDGCYNMTYVVLKINGIVIPLCEDCLSDLKSSIKEFDELQLCCRCENLVSRGAGSLYHYGKYFCTTALSYGKNVAKYETIFIENRIHKTGKKFSGHFHRSISVFGICCTK